MKKQEENFRETLGSKAVEQRREAHLQPSPKSTIELFFAEKAAIFRGTKLRLCKTNKTRYTIEGMWVGVLLITIKI